MSNDMNKTVREFYKAVEGVKSKKTGGYDVQATVRRVEDGVAWVHIPDGVDETPARLTINAKEGDVVQVRVVNGRAFLVGNASAPPTDNTEAIKALSQADVAAQAATIARLKAEEATTDAARAHEAADAAQQSADDAAQAASDAQDSADAAAITAGNAQTSATTANTAANNALQGLSTVESVVDAVNWFNEHKTASTDTAVDPSKTYYSYDAQTGALTKLDPDGTEDPSALGWYEMSDAVADYVATHVATTADGLSVLSAANGWRVLISSGGGNKPAGIFLIDPNGNIAQQTTINGVEFNTGRAVKIGDQTAYINFDGNGNISVIGANITIGGANNTSGQLTVKDALNNTIGTWNKDGFVAKSGSTNASFAVDDSSIRLVDREGTEFFRIADLRNENGYARLTYRLELDSELGLEPHQDLLTPSTEMKDVISVYYNNTLWVEGTDYEIDYNNNSIVNLYALHLYPNDVFEVTYLADDARLKAYTLGTRAKYTDSGYYSVSMGVGNTIDGEYSTAIGRNNTIGRASDSFVAGSENVANGTSWMMGWGLKSGTSFQTIVGLWNKPLDDTLKYALIVGGGLGDSNRFNAMTVDRDGILKTGSLMTNIASKSAYNDGVAGVYVSSTGVIHLTRSATSGGYIGFHYGLGAATTSSIEEVASGVLRISGGLRINGHSSGIGTVKGAKNTSAVTIPAGGTTGKTVTSLSLEAGCWIAICRIIFSNEQSATYIRTAVNSTANSTAADDQRTASGNSQTTVTVCKILTTSETTTYYLSASNSVAHTVAAEYGTFYAVRIQ